MDITNGTTVFYLFILVSAIPRTVRNDYSPILTEQIHPNGLRRMDELSFVTNSSNSGPSD